MFWDVAAGLALAVVFALTVLALVAVLALTVFGLFAFRAVFGFVVFALADFTGALALAVLAAGFLAVVAILSRSKNMVLTVPKSSSSDRPPSGAGPL